MQRPFFLAWRGQREAGDLAAVVRRVEQDDVVAVARRRPVAVDRLRLEDPLRFGLLDQAAQDRPQLLLRPGEELVERAAVLLEAPVELVEHVLVQVRHQRLDRHLLDQLRAPERRPRDLDAAGELVAPQPGLLDLDRAQRPAPRRRPRRAGARACRASAAPAASPGARRGRSESSRRRSGPSGGGRRTRRGRRRPGPRRRPGRSRSRRTGGSAQRRPASPGSRDPGGSSRPCSRA